jgi:RNA polymerase sigma-70 factor (ECF subfamily)
MDEDFARLRAWRDGDGAAGDELVKRHFAALYRFFYTKVPNEARDLAQQTFLACLGAALDEEREGSFRGFLYVIARRQLLMHLRKRYRGARVFHGADVSVSECCADDVPSPSGAVARDDERRLLVGALRRIPLDFQIVVELFYWDELPVVEIARVLEVAVGTVKSRLGRARAMLRDELAKLSAPDHLHHTSEDGLAAWARSMRAIVTPDEG